MRKYFGFFFALALITTVAVVATTQSNEEVFASAELETEQPEELTDVQALAQVEADDIFVVLAEHADLSTFSTALRASGLMEKLGGGDAFTIFAPNNVAFDALPKGTVEQLLMPENRDGLISLMKNHLFSGKTSAEAITGAKSLEAWSGGASEVSVGSAGVFVSGAKVVKSDVEVQGGIVHVIDKVLVSD
jgi:uncharacterized surface protein with fasciclin (FAS1) repeats